MRRRSDANDRVLTVHARRPRRPTTLPGPARTSRGRTRISNPTSGRKTNPIRPLDAKRKSYRRRRHEEEPNEREPQTTTQNKDVMNECSWIVSSIVLEVSPGGPPDVPSRTPRKPPRWARGLLGPKIVKFYIGFQLTSDQILTAAASRNFASPGPVRICSYFGRLAGPIFG